MDEGSNVSNFEQCRGWRVAALVLVVGVSAVARAGMAQPVASQRQPLSDVLERPALMSKRASQAVFVDVARAGDRLVAVGERGIVMLSDDSGRSWSQAKVPVSVLLTSVQFVDAQVGWAVGHGGVVLRSIDGGLNWTLQLDGRQAADLESAAARQDEADDQTYRKRRRANAERFMAEGPDKPFLDVHFADRENGLVVGAYGLIFATQDGGETWQSLVGQLKDQAGRHLYKIVEAPEATFIVGESGAIYRRPKGDAAFREVETPYRGSFFGAVRDSEGDMLLFGLRGNVYRAKAGTTQWTRIGSGTTSNITGGLSLGAGRTLLCDDSGRVHLVSAESAAATPFAGFQSPSLSGMVQAPDGSIVLSSVRGMQRLDQAGKGAAK